MVRMRAAENMLRHLSRDSPLQPFGVDHSDLPLDLMCSELHNEASLHASCAHW